MILFWGFYDPSSGTTIAFRPISTFFKIELATGPLQRRISVPFLGHVQDVVPNRFHFEATKQGLKRGMGKLRFYGRRYDGTSERKESGGVRPATAYERIQYVATALYVMDRNNGRFPYVFEPKNIHEKEGVLLSLRQSFYLSASAAEEDPLCLSESGELDDIEGSECFDLLIKYSHLNEETVSFWCLWNFVNVVYWQLRDMQYPDSPLNSACTPGKNGKFQVQHELVKGHLVSFMLRTAREFAIRQTRETIQDQVKK